MIRAIHGMASGSSSISGLLRHLRGLHGGRTHLCRDKRLIGWQRDGGYADRLVAPERCLLSVPDDIEDRLAPLLLDTIGTTAHGVRLARRIAPGGRVLVLGAGPIGLGAILVLRHFGYGPIDVIDPVAYRAEVAASLGARDRPPARRRPPAATAS